MGLGLVDIAKPVETYDLRGNEVEVRGLKLREAAQLVFRFPDLRRMLETSKWDVTTICGLSDDIAAAIIAGGVDALSEESADNLAIDEKLDLLGVIMRLTMPRGVGPFVGALTRLIAALSAEASSTGSDTKSSKRSTTSSARATTKAD